MPRRPQPRHCLPLLLAAVLVGGCHSHTRMNTVSNCGSQVTASTSDTDGLLLIPFLVLWTLMSLADG